MNKPGISYLLVLHIYIQTSRYMLDYVKPYSAVVSESNCLYVQPQVKLQIEWKC